MLNEKIKSLTILVIYGKVLQGFMTHAASFLIAIEVDRLLIHAQQVGDVPGVQFHARRDRRPIAWQVYIALIPVEGKLQYFTILYQV